ncbi:MAG: GNAT family N-acetyltransferase [Devosiaceae bacterium]|nr:GNAT family N-acetyltransferase [Devosiaceae bacterium]
MLVSINIETPLQDDVRHLVELLNGHLEPLSPIEHQYKMNVDEMARSDTKVFVARNMDKNAIGMAALKIHKGHMGEVKRMFTIEKVRGQRVGVKLLSSVILQAQRLDIKKLVLETGFGAGYADAHRLYQRAGFIECGPVLDYEDTGSSAFFEMDLNFLAKDLQLD